MWPDVSERTLRWRWLGAQDSRWGAMEKGIRSSFHLSKLLHGWWRPFSALEKCQGTGFSTYYESINHTELGIQNRPFVWSTFWFPDDDWSSKLAIQFPSIPRFPQIQPERQSQRQITRPRQLHLLWMPSSRWCICWLSPSWQCRLLATRV